jgi:hypothetical protein
MHKSVEEVLVCSHALEGTVPDRSASVGFGKDEHIAVVRLKLEVEDLRLCRLESAGFCIATLGESAL